MTSKDIQEMINVIEDQIERFGPMNSLKVQLSVLKSYKQDLERLEELKKVINKEYTHWKRIKYNDEMNGHSNNTADYCVEFLSFLKEVLCVD